MTDEQAAAAAALGDAFGETGTGDAEMAAEERLGRRRGDEGEHKAV